MTAKILVYSQKEIIALVIADAKKNGYDVKEGNFNRWMINGDERIFSDESNSGVELILPFTKQHLPESGDMK